MSLNPRIGSQINYATIVALKVCVSPFLTQTPGGFSTLVTYCQRGHSTFGTSWDEVSVSVLVTSSLANSIDSI